MKKITFITLCILITYTSSAQSVSVGGIELAATVDTLSGSSGNFLDFNSATSSDIISSTTLETDLTDSSESTYVLSVETDAYVDLAFNSVSIFNGAGYDLAIFFAGSLGDTGLVNINFDLDIDAGGPGNRIRYTPQITPTETVISDAFGDYTLTAALIDLDDFGFATDIALQDFRIYLGSNGSTNHPSLSLVGGFHTSAISAVPLPLPIVLFSSGLGLLGLFIRKRA